MQGRSAAAGYKTRGRMNKTRRNSWALLGALCLGTQVFLWSEEPAVVPSIQDVPVPTTAELSEVIAATGAPLGKLPFRLYRWAPFPSILIFDIADFATQDRMFSRMAFFLEKRGFRGKLLSNRDLKGRHGWNAHDYGAEGLARFFNAAAQRGFPLNQEELLVERIALREKILRRQGETLEPGEGGLITVSRASSSQARHLLLTHESFHGIFFASEAYRALCFDLWDKTDRRVRTFVESLLSALGYDTGDPYLVVNEYEAYLLQQPESDTPIFFNRVAGLISGEKGVPQISEILPALMEDRRRMERFLSEQLSVRPKTSALWGNQS